MAGSLRSIFGEIKLKDSASSAVRSFKKSMDEAKSAAFSVQNSLEFLGGREVTRKIFEMGKMFSDAGAENETQALRIRQLAGSDYPELKKSIDEAVESSRGLFGESDFQKSANEALKFGASVSLVSDNLGTLQKLSAIAGTDLTSTMQGITTAVNTGSVRFLKSNSVLAKHMDGFKALGSGYDDATKKRRELYMTEVFKKEELKIMEQYGEVLDTMNGTTERAKTQWGEVKEVIGEFINKGLQPIVAVGADVLQWFAGTERGVAILKTVVIALTPVVGVLLVAALYSAAAAAWAFVAPLLPFIAIGLAVVAVITMIVLAIEDIYTWFNGGESVFGSFAKSLKETFYEVLEYIKAIPGRIVEFFRTLPARLKAELIQIKNDLANIFSGDDMNALDFVKAAIPNVPGKARGGSVSAGRPYVVGERGPELFMPGSSGSIIPNGQLGGVTIQSIVGSMVFNVSGSAEAAQAVESAVMDALNKLSRTVFRAELGMEVS
jgi:hypothetical protein